MIAIQGPKAKDVASEYFKEVNETMYFMDFINTKYNGNEVRIARIGYTGEDGFEISSNSETIFEIAKSISNDERVTMCGLGARDTLRLEMGFCLYGNDIDDTTSPLEAGLGWITKFSKDFVDADFLKKQKEDGITRKLIAFEMIDRGIPRSGYEITDDNGNIIGNVTSGTMSPSMKKAIGLGYVKKDFSKIENSIYIAVRNKKLKASIVKLPFYKK